MYSYSLAEQLLGLLMNFDWLVYSVEFPNVSTTNCNLQKVLFYVLSLGILYINLSVKDFEENNNTICDCSNNMKYKKQRRKEGVSTQHPPPLSFPEEIKGLY